MYFRAKMSCPPKLTELLRLCTSRFCWCDLWPRLGALLTVSVLSVDSAYSAENSLLSIKIYLFWRLVRPVWCYVTPFIIQWTQRAKIKGKKPDLRIFVHSTSFAQGKFGTLACPELSCLWHGTVQKNLCSGKGDRRKTSNPQWDGKDPVFKPPPPVGAGGGYMFSGRPSVPLSVRPCRCPSVHLCVRPWFTW